jgi:secretion/DNA translocation related TadE-like protein
VSAERGSATVVTAAILAAVMVLALGAADLARVLVAVSRAQTAADAAALAAAQSLAFPSEIDPAVTAADLAARNGGRLRSCACDPVDLTALVVVEVPVGALLLSSDDRVAVARARAIVDAPAA